MLIDSFICVSCSFVSVAGLLAARDELKAQTQSYSLREFVCFCVLVGFYPECSLSAPECLCVVSSATHMAGWCCG